VESSSLDDSAPHALRKTAVKTANTMPLNCFFVISIQLLIRPLPLSTSLERVSSPGYKHEPCLLPQIRFTPGIEHPARLQAREGTRDRKLKKGSAWAHLPCRYGIALLSSILLTD